MPLIEIFAAGTGDSAMGQSNILCRSVVIRLFEIMLCDFLSSSQAVRQDHHVTWQKRYWPVKTRFLIRNQTVHLKSGIHEMALRQSGAPTHRSIAPRYRRRGLVCQAGWKTPDSMI